MKFQIKGLPLFATAAVFFGLFILLNFVKLSAIVSVPLSYFSFASVIFPLAGFLGVGSIGIVTLARLLVAVVFYGTPLSATVYYIPTVFASAYWTLNKRVFPVVISCVCIALFVAHPVGFKAAAYSFYWFIPFLLAFSPRRFIFTDALSSTFIAHAVGSVIWLYAHPTMPASQWLFLIPLVAIERCIFALGMTGVYCAVAYLKKLVFGKIKSSTQSQAIS